VALAAAAIILAYASCWFSVRAVQTLGKQWTYAAREGGKLMAQESNETEKTELVALSDSTFVIRGDSILITFEKGTDGKVTRMLFHDIGGSVQALDRSVTDRK
jgi:hypothetical protein